MKRIIIIVVVIIVLAVVGVFVYRSFLAPAEATPTPELDSEAVSTLSSLVSAEGFVVPARRAELSFKGSGQIVDLPVAEGDWVENGESLASLDGKDQEVQVRQAEAGVEQAQAGVEQALAGIQQAEAGLEQAQANVSKAESAAASAQAQSNQIKAGPTQETIDQAEASLRTAGARLDQTMASARPEDIDVVAATLLKTEAALRQAQAAYDEVSWADTKGETPQALALEQATLDYQSAKASYDRVANGPTAEEIAVARASVGEAEAALAAAKAGATDEDVAVAEAAVFQAKQVVVEAEAGVSAAQATLASANASHSAALASLSTAESTLEAAQNQLADFQLLAPFAGTVSRIDANVGELVNAGVPFISLGDDSSWQVETDDLSEIDIVEVRIGQSARVTVDALPGQEFDGIVADITPRSETKRGDVTYTVTIELNDAGTETLRWGMTAFVDIDVK